MTISNKFYLNPSVMHILTSTTNNSKQFEIKEKLLLQKDNNDMKQLLSLLDIYVINKTDLLYINGVERFSFGMVLKDISTLLKRITARIFRLGRTIIENITKNYTVISKLWINKLQKHIDEIDENEFFKIELKTVSYDVLSKRIAVIGDIKQLLSHIPSIINNPINDVDDENAYNTPEFITVYKKIKEIGFNMTNKVFTESQASGYKNQYITATIEKHGYTKSHLPELMKYAEIISEFTKNNFIKKIIEDFKKTNESLENYEKNIIHNTILDDSRKEEELKKTQIKISRLWYLSNFVHILQKLSEDQMKIILNIFRSAEKAIPFAKSEDDDLGPGQKYFL